jgi:hypothetical protein
MGCSQSTRLIGGYCRGHLLCIVIWDVCHGPFSAAVHRLSLAELCGVGLWLGLEHAPSHHQQLSVAHRCHNAETFFALLCLCRRPPLHGPLAVVGADRSACRHPGTPRRTHRGRTRRLYQEKSGPPHRRARSLPQRCGLGASRVSHLARLTFCPAASCVCLWPRGQSTA